MAVWVTAAFLASMPIPACSGHGAMLTNSLYSNQEAWQKPYRTVVRHLDSFKGVVDYYLPFLTLVSV